MRGIKNQFHKLKTVAQAASLALGLAACGNGQEVQAERDPTITSATTPAEFIANCREQLEGLGIEINNEDFRILTRAEALRVIYFAIINAPDDETGDEEICQAMIRLGEQVGREIIIADCSKQAYATEAWFIEIFNTAKAAYFFQDPSGRNGLEELARYVAFIGERCQEATPWTFPTILDETIVTRAASCPTTRALTYATGALSYGDGSGCER